MELRKLEEAKIKKLKKLKNLLRNGAITELQFRTASDFVREYYHSKACKLKESKTNQLKKLLNAGNITEDQFNTADKFFKTYSAYEKEIDWNKGLDITWEDLDRVIKKERNTKSQIRNKIRKGLKGFEEGKDYLVIGEGEYDGKSWVAYQPLTWEASRMIASHYLEPSKNEIGNLDDANWCTADQNSSDHWDEHNEIEAFIYLCGESIPTKKVAISISKEKYDANDTEFLYSINSFNLNIWDFSDFYDTVKKAKILKIVPNLYILIEKAYNNWKNRCKEIIISRFTLNPQTNKYDYNGNLKRRDLKFFVSEDKKGFTINFGEVTGDFDCSNLGLKSLKGSPQKVGVNFDCDNNELTSLEGAPQKIGRVFYCRNNQLTSLEGAPQKVKFFICSKNKLTTLKGAPQKIGVSFDCDNNELTSLEGAPQIVKYDFSCRNNKLTTLKGAPQTVGRWFSCDNNELASLEGAPRIVGGDFDCYKNPQLHSLDGIGEVKGKIYKDF